MDQLAVQPSAMRILHTADWHIGQELHGFDRSEEHRLFFEWLVETIDQRSVDVLLMAGDVFHTVNPPATAQRQLYELIARLRGQHPQLQILLTGGNHDSPSRLELPTALLADPKLCVIGAAPRRDGEIDFDAMSIPLHGPQGDVSAVCAAVPFLRAGDLGSADLTGASDGESAALRAFYAQAAAAAQNRAPGKPLIMTGHLTVSGAELSTLSERRISIGGAEAVSSDVFPREAAYVALGHLHRPQRVSGAIEIRYSGSPFPLSATERGYRHSVALLELSRGRIETELLPIPRPAEFLRVPERGAATLAEAEAALAELDIPDRPLGLRPFLDVSLRLDGPVPDLRARIDAALDGAPVRLGRIQREAPPTAPGEEATPIDLATQRPEAVFELLHRQKHGAPPSRALLAAFKQARAEAEIGHAGEDKRETAKPANAPALRERAS